MYTVEYKNPYTKDMRSKSFKGRRSSAQANAQSYARELYNNYYQTVTIHGYETMAGKTTGREFTYKGTDKNFLGD